MRTRRDAHRSDINQPEIMDRLRSIGCSIEPLTAQGGGCPDLLVGYRGLNILLEVKPPKGKLRQSQIIWHDRWLGQVAVVHTPDEAERAVKEYYEKCKDFAALAIGHFVC